MFIFLAMPTIKFFIRSNNDKKQSSVIYCRITVNDTSAEFSTKEKIDKRYWNQSMQKYKSPNKLETNYINSLVESISYKIKSKTLHLAENLNAKELISLLTRNGNNEKPILISDLIEAYISDLIEVGKVAPGTIKNHNIKLKNLKLYEIETKGQFTPTNFDLPTAERFKKWFMTKNNTKNVSTANRNVTFFADAMRNAAKNGVIKHFELLMHRGQKDSTKPPIFLTEKEVLDLMQYKFSGVMLQKVKDLYLFQISTGLSFADIWSDFDVKETSNGKVLIGKRGKNNQEFFIPLDPIAETILNKYEGKLPIYCNAVYNRILKEIAAILGIDKKLTTHTGRKTFATMQDSKGWSRESIAMMLGHRSVKTTEMYYLGQTFSRIENEWSNRI